MVFGKGFERRKSVTPEPVEIVADLRDAAGVELIESPGTNLLISDQVSFLQHAQMLGHGWPAHRKIFCDFVHGGRPFRKTLKNG